MSSKAVTPHGSVTQGDFLNCNIYVWETNKSLMIVDGIIDRGMFAAPYTNKQIIDTSSVKSFQLINTTQASGANATAVGATAFFLGRSAAQTLINAVQVSQYNVAIYFKDGKKCVAQLNDFAYNTLTSACFVL